MSLKEKLNGYNQLHKVKIKDDSNELFGSITLQNIIDKDLFIQSFYSNKKNIYLE